MLEADTQRKVSAAERIAAEVRRRVAAGKYPPHSYLPSERELAQELSVGRNTVSAALTTLTQEGYVLKTSGRGTRVLPHQERLSRKAVGVVHSLSATPPAEPLRVMAGIQDAFSRFGYRYELASRRERSESADALQEHYGGLIFVETVGYEEDILELERRRIPLVVANMEVDLDVTATWVDHRKATCQAVKALVGFGHRRIAFLGRDHGWLFYGKAREGYLAGLKEAGIAPDGSLVAVCEDTDPLSAYLATKALLEVPEAPTAIVAARDILAQGACRAATEAGFVVGRDVSIIGFDDISWRQAEPFLTTFQEPCRELGTVAAELLVERIVNGWRPPEKREMEAPLVLRRSAGPLMHGSATRETGEHIGG